MADLQNTAALRILVVEDEHKLGCAIAHSLEALGWHPTLAKSGEEGYYLAQNQAFDLALLDVNLPGRDGLEILRALRSNGWQTPVLILSARDSLELRVQGFDHGADDYLAKPFDFPELHARLRALSRRMRRDENVTLRCGDLELDRLQRCVTRDGKQVALTAKEFELLEFLMRHSGQVVSRIMIAQNLWQTRAHAVPLNNVIDVHMARLRAKIDAPHPAPLIRTVRGVGFAIQS